MRHYDEIFEIAAGRHGGAAALEDRLSQSAPLAQAALAAIPDDRWLSIFTKAVFQAGFNWKVIEAKWDGFETAFKGFDVDACAMMNDDWFDALVADTRIVRNGAKIQTVRDNAVMIQQMRDSGGAGPTIAQWPSTDFIGLLALLKTQGARLGGTSGQYALRFMGKDSFILSADVVGRLIAEGIIDKPPTSKTAMRAVQEAFNTWAAQSDRSLTAISRTLALSL